ncbi:hypothetical protein ACW9H6_15085 [Pseudomonas sp. SDO528_S397]
MGSLIDKPAARKAPSKTREALLPNSPTANQQRFLKAALAGSSEEPSLLAGRSEKQQA